MREQRLEEERAIELLVLGSAAVLPERHRDTASFLIDGELLVDCGWRAVLGMVDLGLSPLSVRHVLFTHFHHDHYLGLPQLLFYKGHGARGVPSDLQVIGPKEQVSDVVERACRFLQAETFPDVVPKIDFLPLEPNQTVFVGSWKLTTCKSIHPVPGLSYRIESEDGCSIVLSGDTAYNPELVNLARGADILVHEASYGAKTPESNASGHAGGLDAAQVAKAAGVRRLLLVHTSDARRLAAVEAARSQFENVHFASEGERYCVMK